MKRATGDGWSYEAGFAEVLVPALGEGREGEEGTRHHM